VRLTRAQRSIVYATLAAIVIALGIGLWPVTASVFGDPSYSCGSGFFHSGHKWRQDSVASRDARTGDETATGPPSQVCPSKVYNRRDWAVLLGSFAVVIGVVTLALTSRQQDRGTQAIFASQRLRKR
jgi:hypothetical protein